MGKLYTINEACAYFNITRKTLFNWRKSNRIKTIETPSGIMVDIDTETSKSRKNLHKNEPELLSLIHELHKKIDNLTQELHTIKQSMGKKSVTTTHKPQKQSPAIKGANEVRQQEAINKARAKFIELGSPNISRAELARKAGVDRNTVGKHWVIITQGDLED